MRAAIIHGVKAAAIIFFLTALSIHGESAVATKLPFVFRDVGSERGLLPDLNGIRGHGAAWGDVDDSGYPALFINSFHDYGSKGALFFRNNKGKFRLDSQTHLRTSGAGSGALFVDLTNSGRLDLYVSNCAIDRGNIRRIPNFLFRNNGAGKFTDVTKNSGASLPLFAGRGLATMDFDGDGLLDLLLCECYCGAVKHGPTLLRNLGNYRFKNVSKEAGLPPKLSGLGVAVADLNNDGWPDIFLTAEDGNNRLYLNDTKGKFYEPPNSRKIFRWKGLKDYDVPAGICISDVNNDGLPDIVIGRHSRTPWRTPASIRLYLNRGVKNGSPVFKDITKAAGLLPLAMKAPHVEIQDFDNDGLPDIYVSIVKFKHAQPYPIIFKNLGMLNGIPHFRADALIANDFPNKEELARKKEEDFFDKMVIDRRIIYMASGPSSDFDRDGRLDLILPNWWIKGRSLLLRNETSGGNWLEIRVNGPKEINRMGIGSKVKIYPAGKLGETSALLGFREINVGYGYCSGQEAVAHFGLGPVTRVDVEITFPDNKRIIIQKNISVNQRLTLRRL